MVIQDIFPFSTPPLFKQPFRHPYKNKSSSALEGTREDTCSLVHEKINNQDLGKGCTSKGVDKPVPPPFALANGTKKPTWRVLNWVEINR